MNAPLIFIFGFAGFLLGFLLASLATMLRRASLEDDMLRLDYLTAIGASLTAVEIQGVTYWSVVRDGKTLSDPNRDPRMSVDVASLLHPVLEVKHG